MRTLSLTAVILVAASVCLAPHTAQASTDPVKVILMSGQSNMIGHGKTEFGLNPDYDGTNTREIQGGIGGLRWLVEEHDPGTYGFGGTNPLVDSNGDWLVRDDVSVFHHYDSTYNGDGSINNAGATESGYHTTGFGKGNWNGPEYGFGQVVGNATDDDYVIIKVAWGGKTLAEDFRSPTAVANRGGETGFYWEQMKTRMNAVLSDFDTQFPDLAGREVEIAGFGWHQGWNDGGNQAMVDEYEENMVDFITDVRDEWGSDLAFVIANTGIGGDNISGTRLDLVEAQNAVGDPNLHPELVGNVAVVDTRGFYRDSTESPSTLIYHWNHNGETHYDIGAGMGEAYLSLVPEPSSLTLLGLSGLLVLRRRRCG